MSQKVYGKITNYRTGPKSQVSNECLIEFQGINSKSLAGKLIGQKVAWKSGKSMILGKIKDIHGKNGMVKVKFRKGVPGQAIGTVVELMS